MCSPINISAAIVNLNSLTSSPKAWSDPTIIKSINHRAVTPIRSTQHNANTTRQMVVSAWPVLLGSTFSLLCAFFFVACGCFRALRLCCLRWRLRWLFIFRLLQRFSKVAAIARFAGPIGETYSRGWNFESIGPVMATEFTANSKPHF